MTGTWETADRGSQVPLLGMELTNPSPAAIKETSFVCQRAKEAFGCFISLDMI